jgi:hypothetical protein
VSDGDETGPLAGLRASLPAWASRYLPSVKERGTYTGPLSTFAEYHAVGVGFALGPQSGEVLAAYGAGSGGGKARRSGHLTDAWKELAYVGLGAGLRLGLGAVV